MRTFLDTMPGWVRGFAPVVLGALVLSTLGIYMLRSGPTPPLSTCQHLGPISQYQYRCYREGIERKLNAEGPKAALPALDRMATKDQRLDELCHPLMHVVSRPRGADAYRRHITNPLKGAPASPRICSVGYVHGIMEGYARASGGALAIDDAQVAVLCRDKRTTYTRFACVHALGHAVFQAAGARARPALEHCARLRSRDHVECASGVMMSEYTVLAFDAKHPPDYMLDPVAARTRCDTFDGLGRMLCYRWLPLASSLVDGPSFTAVQRLCDSLPIGDEGANCMIGIGQLYVPEGMANTLRAQCAAIRSDAKRVPCIYGSASKRGQLTTDDVQQIAAACAKLPTVDRLACYMAVGRMQFFIDAPRTGEQPVCESSGLAGDELTWCRRGADLVDENSDGSPTELRAVRELQAFVARGAGRAA